MYETWNDNQKNRVASGSEKSIGLNENLPAPLPSPIAPIKNQVVWSLARAFINGLLTEREVCTVKYQTEVF